MKNVMRILMVFLLVVLATNQGWGQTTTNPDSVCFGSTNESYWVAPNVNSTFSWSVDALTGAVITSGANTNAITVDWSSASVGYYTDAITLVETDNSSGCSGFVTIDVEVLPLPTAPTGNDVTACETGPIPDLMAVGAEVIWYSDIALTIQVGTGNTLATGETAIGSYIYYATETLNGCEGPSTAITLTIIAAPTADAGLDATICEGETYTLSGNASNNNGQLWTTSGDGLFSGASGLNPIYTPGINDVALGNVTLTLTSFGNGSCAAATDDLVLSITPMVTVDAGLDDAICEGDTYTLIATATNDNGVQWTTSGDGSFSNTTDITPIYTPGATDIINGTVMLTLTATGNSPCANLIDDMVLSITPAPTADAGSDAAICEGDTYTLSGTASNNNGQLWTTSGDGLFSDASVLNPVYTPGVNDIVNGGVTLILTTFGNGTCPNSLDDMFLSITPSATADAGSDAAICEGDTYTLISTATNNNGVQWTTSGDGWFSSTAAVTPVYTPGATDIINGTVTLTLTATGNSPCADAVDDVVISITPAATADAGANDAICDIETYTLSGAAANYNTITWTTSGDGTFSDINVINPIYTPGPIDIVNGIVNLTLLATGNGACADATSVVIITINPTPSPGPIQHN